MTSIRRDTDMVRQVLFAPESDDEKKNSELAEEVGKAVWKYTAQAKFKQIRDSSFQIHLAEISCAGLWSFSWAARVGGNEFIRRFTPVLLTYTVLTECKNSNKLCSPSPC